MAIPRDDNPDTLPMVTVVLPRALLNLFPDAPQRVEFPAATVGDVMDELELRWPGMRDRLCDSTPAIRRHINVFYQGQRAKLDAPLAHGATIYVLTAVSGG